MRVNPRLSAFSEDPDGGRVLDGAPGVWEGKDPEGSWGETEIRLMATVGLRFLGSELQQRILESCRQVL